jgi:hypothetical protein
MNSKRSKMNSTMTMRTSKMNSKRSKMNKTMTTRTSKRSKMKSTRSEMKSTRNKMISMRMLKIMSKRDATIQGSRSLRSTFGTEATLRPQLIVNCHRLTIETLSS